MSGKPLHDASPPTVGPSFDFMDHTSDLALVVDAHGAIRSVSRSVERVLGRSADALSGRPWRELVHPEDRSDIGRPPGDGQPELAGRRFRLLDAEGLSVWVEGVGLPSLTPAEGHGAVVICREVSHEVEGEKLGALLQRLTALANETADLHAALGRAALDICGTMNWSSGQAFVGTGGHVRPVAEGTDSAELSTARAASIRDRCLRSGRASWEVAANGAGPQLYVSVPVRTDEATVGVLLFTGEPERVSDAFLAVMENVGWQLGMVASRQADRVRLEQHEAELRRSNEELERFAYVASHDLQEPLRKVVTACELLERRFGGELGDSGGARYVEVAVDAARRMQLLIRDLLAYSRVGRGNHEPVVPVDLAEVVADVCAELSHPIEQAGARVDVGPLPTVPVSRHELHQVFVNLISNAVKFRGSAPPRISIDGRARDGEVEITVCDNGIGVDPQYAERIFDVFRRLHRHDEYAGTGIGLAIAKRIVEHHGGRIWLTPVTTGGSCFHFTLPSGHP